MKEVMDTTISPWEWIWEHRVEVVLLVLCGGLIYLALNLLFVRYPQAHQQEIELCQRAFEYTAEQCEFIVRNRVMLR